MSSCFFSVTAPVQAQYTVDFQTNVVSGVTSNWTGDYLVGSNTVADALLIQTGGVLSNGFGYLGYEVNSSNNNVVVTDPGSIWSNSLVLYVGYGGAGNSLVISNGGGVVNDNGYVGYSSGASNNSVVVTDTGSVWRTTGTLYVGADGGANSLVISNGGRVASGSGKVGIWISYTQGRNNSVRVTGPGSIWSNSLDLAIGQGSGNRLVIDNGGQVRNRDARLGSNSHSSSAVVADAGSVWSNDGAVYVGYSGWGNSLVISNGGRVFSAGIDVGNNASASNNIVVIADTGSVWNSGDVYIGDSGSGNSLVISNGSVLQNSYNSYVGYDFGSTNNSVLVTGPGSVWSNSPNYGFDIGYSGSGNSLVITNGGQVISSFIGDVGLYASSSSNSVRVVDNGSLMGQQFTIRIGFGGSSNSLVVDGGTVLAANLTIGVASAACDNLVQLNSGSINVTNAPHPATLEVRNGKLILNGGVLQVERFVMTEPCAQFVRTGGTLIYGTAVLDPTRDDDGDGMPNGWEQSYGLDPLNAADAHADPDGDGMSNLEEYQAGTDPTNSASVFRIVEIAPDDDDMLISWTAVGGKRYALQTTTADTGDSFTNNFIDLNPAIVASGTGETTVSVLHLGAATNAPSRFYRVRLVP